MGIFKNLPLARSLSAGKKADRHDPATPAADAEEVDDPVRLIIRQRLQSQYDDQQVASAMLLKKKLIKRLSMDHKVPGLPQPPTPQRRTRSVSLNIPASPKDDRQMPTRSSHVQPLTSPSSVVRGTDGAPSSPSAVKSLVHARLRGLPDDCKGCSICFDLFEVGRSVTYMPCGHFCHSKCLMPWLERHGTCPTCRESVPSRAYVPLTDSDHSNQNGDPHPLRHTVGAHSQQLGSILLSPRRGGRHSIDSRMLGTTRTMHDPSTTPAAGRRRPPRADKPSGPRQKSRSLHTGTTIKEAAAVEDAGSSKPRRRITSVIVCRSNHRATPNDDSASSDRVDAGDDDNISAISIGSFNG